MRAVLLATALILALPALPAAPIRVSGTGFVTDAGHPKHPGDSHRYEATLTLEIDAAAGMASIEIETRDGDEKDVDRYYVRRGRIFQVGDDGVEVPPRSLGELSVAAVAALHPALTASAMRERAENVREEGKGRVSFAWSDVLWTVTTTNSGRRIAGLVRSDADAVLGDSIEKIEYETDPPAVRVTLRERETARFTFAAPEAVASVEIPKGDERRDRGYVVRASEIAFTEIAPHLFTIDLASISSRVTVAEFADHLVVLEGAYNPRNGDLLARAIRERFGKPIRYHAFSHLHGQYVGSTRSYVAEGATILVPPTTAPMIEAMAAAPYAHYPDALGKSPRKPSVETIPKSRRLEDGTNALVAYNVVSEHTDEYLIFWFPGPKVLLTGDLLFYRPGKALTGRSKRLCQTVADLGLDVERFVATWPLDGYGTENVVTGEKFKTACAATP
jgi:hypothetical protein